jgi:hypothetical protein
MKNSKKSAMCWKKVGKNAGKIIQKKKIGISFSRNVHIFPNQHGFKSLKRLDLYQPEESMD